MELSRYLDLYLAESQEHLRELNRSLLELEQGGGGDAVTRAFRAAHTLKGMSATMGFSSIAELAHGLEDRLAEIRDGRLEVEPALIDQLLASADALEQGVAKVVVAEATPGREGEPAVEALAPPPSVPAPAPPKARRAAPRPRTADAPATPPAPTATPAPAPAAPEKAGPVELPADTAMI